MVQGAQFRLFGFPVTIRPGFVVIIAIIAFVYGGALGPWLAGSLAAFTLLHELGHAWRPAASAPRPSIALDLLYGYASYVPSPAARPMGAGRSSRSPARQSRSSSASGCCS